MSEITISIKDENGQWKQLFKSIWPLNELSTRMLSTLPLQDGEYKVETIEVETRK